MPIITATATFYTIKCDKCQRAFIGWYETRQAAITAAIACRWLTNKEQNRWMCWQCDKASKE